jgi:hypothetical protein
MTRRQNARRISATNVEVDLSRPAESGRQAVMLDRVY